ncbi:MAG: FCD domain-containing protein [Immundisolibacterales bacterium]|nr:FCD domain-containing protein [Immundisolibacterales bacterium]
MEIDSHPRPEDRPYRVGAGDIAVQVRRRITGGDLLNGERLPPERAFAEQFGVSRGTVRDALRRLEEGGFVEKRPGSGTYVCFSEVETSSIARSTSPLELIDTRFALEPQIVRLAVLNATERALAKAARALEVMERNEADADAFAAGDETFHLALAECTRNAMLVWITERVSEVRNNAEWARMRQITLSRAMIRRYNAQHRAVFDAVRTRNAEQAARAMKAHLDLARKSLVDAASS